MDKKFVVLLNFKRRFFLHQNTVILLSLMTGNCVTGTNPALAMGMGEKEANFKRRKLFTERYISRAA